VIGTYTVYCTGKQTPKGGFL